MDVAVNNIKMSTVSDGMDGSTTTPRSSVSRQKTLSESPVKFGRRKPMNAEGGNTDARPGMRVSFIFHVDKFSSNWLNERMIF